MSAETIEWLNQNSMIGNIEKQEAYKHLGWGVTFNEQTGQNETWWHTADFKNGYVGPIPPEEVERVLFNWEPIEVEIMYKRRDGVTEANCDAIDGNGPFLWVPSDKFKGIMHPETEHEFAVFGKETYKIHGYKEALLDKVSNILDDGLGIGTAGMLRSGGVAYVSVELPDSIDVHGFEFRPMLMAATSIDGTKATTYKMVDQVPICDNTVDIALSGEGGEFKIRHSSKSLGRLEDARQALGIVYKHAEEMEQFLASLSDVDVTDAQFAQIVKTIKPIPEPEHGIKGGKSVVTNQRAITIADNTQQTLRAMWHNDPRCSPWHGTLLGAFQTANTWNIHERSNSDNGVERTMTSALSGTGAKFDREFFQIVAGLEDIKVPESLSALV